MTALTALELKFADGDYLFDLKLPQLAELQEKRGCGIFKLYGRVMRGRYVIDDQLLVLPEECEAYDQDIYETIRLALIGGAGGEVDGQEVKVTAIRAGQLVERYCHSAPLMESWAIAAAILSAKIKGYTPPNETEADKKKDGAEAGDLTGSTSDESSPTAPSSASTGPGSATGNTPPSTGTGSARTTRKPGKSRTSISSGA